MTPASTFACCRARPASMRARNADVPADVADLNGNGNTTEPLPFDLAWGEPICR